MPTDATLARRVMQRLDALAKITDEPGRLTRTYGSPAMRRANKLVASWMRAAGMTVRTDAIGNLIGRYPGTHAKPETILFGSHLDTVRDAGKFDGALGVLVPLVYVEQLHAEGRRFLFDIEIIA